VAASLRIPGEAGQGLPALPILSLAADGQGTVYAGVAGGGLYALSRR
jgi:hypothetical protein